MCMNCSYIITSDTFSDRLDADFLENKRLLSFGIELTRRCSFDCPFCETKKGPFDREMNPEEIRDSIIQAKELGAEEIVIAGGEASGLPFFFDIISFVRGAGLELTLYTNGNLITDETAQILLSENVNVVLKMDSPDEKTQDIIAGKKGTFRIIQDAFSCLKNAGFLSKGNLSVSSVICRQNIDSLPSFWRQQRKLGIKPRLHQVIPGREIQNREWFEFDSNEIHKTISEIYDIESGLNNKTLQYPPLLPGNSCRKHLYYCEITSSGDVMMCGGLKIILGNIREQKLDDILEFSEVACDLRDYKNYIKGPCSSCKNADNCSGCRGSAYQLTGDYLASDPFCPDNAGKRNEIDCIPFPIKGIVPHKQPMRIVENLVSVGDRTADITVTIKDDMMFAGEDGILDDAVYSELVAQAIAALNGFRHRNMSSGIKEGFLVGVRRFKILGTARVGDTLKISVFKHIKFDDFGVIRGSVSRNGEVLARGEIQVWENNSAEQKN